MRLNIFTVLLFTILTTSFLLADEGMYPLSEIHKLNLRSKGLHVTADDMYSPGKVGLIDAIVQLSGCTGSFVSNDGLIITNHHCAFGAVQAASTATNDYISNGFLAASREKELPAKGYTVRITESYKDVSKEVLAGVSDTMAIENRTKAISKAIKDMVAATEKENPGKRAEVSEMFTGRTYMLFVYTFLKDVRCVYVPPRSIGEFAGEDDNWVWPRHTGDFSFMRAYVAPDGSPADYSPSNVPYHPRKFLKINPAGVSEEDPVFVLGYPGRTFRHRTASYLAFEENIRMPYVADLLDWQIATMEAIGKNDRAVAIKHDGRIKSLANVTKNYRGKLKGLKHLHLVDTKLGEEHLMQAFIDADAARKAAYGTVLSDIEGVYNEMRKHSEYELTLDYLSSSSNLLSIALTLRQAARELAKPEADRDGAFLPRNIGRTSDNLGSTLHNYYEQTDKAFLKEMLRRASLLPAGQKLSVVDSILGTAGNVDTWIDRLYAGSKLSDSAFVINTLASGAEKLNALDDPFIKLAAALEPLTLQLRAERAKRDGALNKYYAKLVDVKTMFQNKDFIPDANSTLRLTFGKIRGYSPADALYASPFTTLKGLADKSTGVEPYNTPEKILKLIAAKEYGNHKAAKLNDVPVAMLYNLDTTGGNSGSPVLDADGNVVGVNFDRAYEATINDYAWSEDYSRSIGVDIRYVLWVLDKYAGAENVLGELGVR